MTNWRFGAFPKLPYSTMQQLNLDWILDRIRRFLPDTGTKGQVLTRTKDGAAWQDVSAVAGSVNSVNGQTGDVVLDAEDVGALPDSYTAPVTSVNGMTGDVVIQAGGGAVDSVNGQTGDVVLDAEDVGALPDSYTAPVSSVNGQTGAVQLTIPDSTSDLTNDAGFITAAQAAAAAPVQSVNGQRGNVNIPSSSFETQQRQGVLFTVPASGTVWITVNAPTGAICACGYYLDSAGVSVKSITFNGTAALLNIRNWTSAAISSQLSVEFLIMVN